MEKIKLSGKFKGWTVDEEKGLLFDDGNNEYELNEIRALHFFRSWHGGDPAGKIRFLRDELQKKIEEAEKRNRPKVTIDWGDHQETLVHPWFRR